MGKPAGESTLECLADGTSQPELPPWWEAAAQDTAERVTISQYRQAKALFEEAQAKHYSQEYLIQQVCVLMASSFREGINLTLETYGLSQKTHSTARS